MLDRTRPIASNSLYNLIVFLVGLLFQAVSIFQAQKSLLWQKFAVSSRHNWGRNMYPREWYGQGYTVHSPFNHKHLVWRFNGDHQANTRPASRGILICRLIRNTHVADRPCIVHHQLQCRFPASILILLLTRFDRHSKEAIQLSTSANGRNVGENCRFRGSIFTENILDTKSLQPLQYSVAKYTSLFFRVQTRKIQTLP
jgi:hypothetical protein